MVNLLSIEDNRTRSPDGEMARLRKLWLHVTALAVADQDEPWIRGLVPGRDLILEAAGIEPGYWNRVMLPVADAIKAERERAQQERRKPKAILLGAPDRTRLRRAGMGPR
jgi:hypothetical protein